MTPPRYTIYLAHPISGLTPEAVFKYYENLAYKLSDYFHVVHPMTAKGALRTETRFRHEGYGAPIADNHAINQRDLWMVGHVADVLLVDLSGTETVSIGCVIETAIGYWTRKHVVVILPEDNVHRHGMLLDCASIVLPNLDEALDYLKRLALGRA